MTGAVYVAGPGGAGPWEPVGYLAGPVTFEPVDDVAPLDELGRALDRFAFTMRASLEVVFTVGAAAWEAFHLAYGHTWERARPLGHLRTYRRCSDCGRWDVPAGVPVPGDRRAA